MLKMTPFYVLPPNYHDLEMLRSYKKALDLAIALSKELPYCHICLNFDRDQIFPYAVRSNGEFIYRCKYSHGHELYPLQNILTGLPVKVHLPRTPGLKWEVEQNRG